MNRTFQKFMLGKDIIKALTSLNYLEPTNVQKEVIPLALKKKDIIVKSQTGSGKTASFAVPLCELVEWEENKPQALVLTPTRELAAQVKDDITNIGRYKRIKATAIFGKQSFQKQQLELKQKSHIVVGTPGRVLDHLEKGTFDVDKLAFLVIDEADEMLNMGFIDQVEAIIQMLPTERMTMLFSATLPEDIAHLSKEYMKDPAFIDIKAEGITTDRIKHIVYKVEVEEKFSILKDITIVENPDSCIVFCATQEEVERVHRKLHRAGYPCGKLHGGLVQEDRFSVMNAFKRGEFRYLIATDVASRGIDVEDISLVINFDIPSDKERYVHRIGRTARAGKTGKAITLVTERETNQLVDIEGYLGYTLSVALAPNRETVSRAEKSFVKKIENRPSKKLERNAKLEQDIMKLYFNGGKKKKIRAVDFVGTICQIDGLTSEDIGIISIQDNQTYVDILNGKGPLVLKEMKNRTVKGKQLKVHEARTK
ncbi:DEAD/DEAH box helicase [Sutcliffiella horikoshii]|uniref:DEAD/DEAH box helicase n=1 Tax=Sutcliffiella horikoshii TaxID=79883 RepID=UPI00203B6804|nr:DEAD/DEAH box helicase [Sutcliffiella horikoshii]MCM3619054.1 DEAD/DEAH box helicase [Sutcliffiella horikoshii]